jgi:hypothetical protein
LVFPTDKKQNTGSREGVLEYTHLVILSESEES